ncbi:LOW QUALITY PROTEIN: hypothetical protein PHMEG_00031847 [Phytophthora megakarya]|uniref:Reverse transcriptase Ty1/copia-type domain-containing protein n=1 Tax=Phytophthora megakarya TaxID=4795 RepID=A0A225UXP7_9STRA|nr:LOW QUALITY PROTEIN: hypothetical protein PHMEG_00031847 [Phytophthora megakarya]
MEEKDVLELVPVSEVPEGVKALETMWRYQLKTDDLGNICRYRSRLCARGDKEVPGIDFNILETFSPVARMASVRLLVALCMILQLEAFQCDINTAYLNARLKKVHFIRRVAGFPLKPGWVYKVKNALYGLHESGHEWYEELHAWLSGKGWQRSATEPCLYFYSEGGTVALVLVYVDDVICATNNERWKEQFFADLNKKYGIKDLGRLHNYLGVQVDWMEDGVILHQTKYAQEILERFGFGGAIGCRSPMDTTVKLRAASEGDKEPGLPYREAVGALMYLATSTRPDLAFPVGYLSRFVQNKQRPFCAKLSVAHAGALKRVLRYLAATTIHGVFFQQQDYNNDEVVTINGYVDADWGNCPDTRKSVSRYVMLMAGGPIAWAARRQSIVALSTAEAEYAAACEACQEGQSIKNILTEVRGVEFTLGIDNQAAITLATRPTYSRKTRHIELQLHYVREMVRQKAVELQKVDGAENPVDLLTKPMGHLRLGKMKEIMGMQPRFSPTQREMERHRYYEVKQERSTCDEQFRDEF